MDKIPKQKKVRLVSKEKYDGSYYIAGALISWTFFGILLISLLVIFLLLIIIRTIYDII